MDRPIWNKLYRNGPVYNINIFALRTVFWFLIGTISAAIVLKIFSFIDDISIAFCNNVKQPTYAVYSKNSNEDHLVHVINVLSQFGYKRVDLNENWDFLWAHDYPFFLMEERMKNLHNFQTVNHIPGCGYLTNKVDLSTTALPFIPRAFKLPRDKEAFIRYSAENPNKLFVEKHNEHRHIMIKSPTKILLNSTNTFVQEFIQNPLLVDGHKFDIGVYVLITSIDPLRVYIYTGDVLFRYCPAQYYPLQQNNVDQYIVGDDYLPTWNMPSLAKYFTQFGGSMKASFNSYINDKSFNSSAIWQQVDDIIRETILTKEADIARIVRSYKTRNFFDLIRFDFVVDKKLRVYLMEANMSPNLSSAHFKQNSLLYEQILYSTLSLVGIASLIQNGESPTVLKNNKVIVTSDKDVATDISICRRYDCEENCNIPKCELCLPCLSESNYQILLHSHREHLHRISMRRLFPKPIMNPVNFDFQKETLNLSARNKWISRWYYNKCFEDSSWCV